MRGKRGMNDAMLGGVGSARTVPAAVAGTAGPDARGGTGNALVVVMTPLMVPLLGIHPVVAVSLLQAVSVHASRATTVRGRGVLRGVPIGTKITGRSSSRWEVQTAANLRACQRARNGGPLSPPRAVVST